jgi:transposase
MKNSNVIGIDLAKDVIQVCKIDKHGELVSNQVISHCGCINSARHEV